MRRKNFQLIIITLVAVISMTGLVWTFIPSYVAMSSEGGGGEFEGIYKSHPTIYINSEYRFDSINGVVKGNGTASDPFIIEGWEIDASNQDPHAVHPAGIMIEGTKSHFIIRNVKIRDGGENLGPSFSGILFYQVQNGTVLNSYFTGNGIGIEVYDSTDCRIIGNSCIMNQWSGISASGSGILVQNNDCSRNGYGILGEGERISILSNRVSNNYYGGVDLEYREGVYLGDCTIANNTISYNLDFGATIGGVEFKDNLVANNGGSGIIIRYSYNLIHNNSIIGNHGAGATISNIYEDFHISAHGHNKIWNNSFAFNRGSDGIYSDLHIQCLSDSNKSDFSHNGYGNYWYDWTSPDNDTNGIIDNPYAIDGIASMEDPFPLAAPPVPISGQPKKPITHYPKIGYIAIHQNADFLNPMNGVIAGTGTDADPYVISGWEISASFQINVTDTQPRTKCGIFIRDTTSHFVIKNVRIDILGDENPTFDNQTVGIYLMNADNAIIENCSIVSTSGGPVDADVLIVESRGVTIRYSDFVDAWVLVKCLDVQNLSLKNNTFSRESAFVNASLEAINCTAIELTNNNATGTNVSFVFKYCTGGKITGNVFEGDYYDVILEGSIGFSIYRNAFLGNPHEYYAIDDNLGGNDWDGGFPVGGNYWDAYSSEDRYSGPNQTDPGSDLVLDRPFLVCPGCNDDYPIVSMKEALESASIKAVQITPIVPVYVHPFFAFIPSAILILCIFFLIPPGLTLVFFGSFIVPLFMRLRDDKILDNFLRGRIYGYISDKPGCTLSDMRRDLFLLNGNLSYHLAVLQRTGLIKSFKDGRDRVFSVTNKEIPIYARLNVGKTGSLIFDVIRKGGGHDLTESQIATSLNMSRQRVHYQLRKLEKRGLVIRTDSGWTIVPSSENIDEYETITLRVER